MSEQRGFLHGGIVSRGIESRTEVLELRSQQTSGIKRRCRGVVQVVPDLIALTNLVIRPEVVAQFRPRQRRGEQPVDHDERLFLGVVGLHQVELWLALRRTAQHVQNSRLVELSCPCEQGGPGNRKIGGEWRFLAVMGHTGVDQRTQQLNADVTDMTMHRATLGERSQGPRDGFRRKVGLNRLPVVVFPNRNQRGSHTFSAMVVDLANLEVVGRTDHVEVFQRIPPPGWAFEVHSVGDGGCVVSSHILFVGQAFEFPCLDEVSQRIRRRIAFRS